MRIVASLFLTLSLTSSFGSSNDLIAPWMVVRPDGMHAVSNNYMPIQLTLDDISDCAVETKTYWFGVASNQFIACLEGKFFFTTNAIFLCRQSGFTFTNSDYANTNGTNCHILLRNTGVYAQSVIASVVNGAVIGKWRTDYAGNCSWIASAAHNFYVGGDFGVGTDVMDMFIDIINVHTDLSVDGKISSVGGYDPPYVLYDAMTRARLKNKVLSEVLAEKQAGAALFWNGGNHRLETYIAAEDRFYAMDGTLLADSNTVDAGNVILRHPLAHPVPAVTNSP